MYGNGQRGWRHHADRSPPSENSQKRDANSSEANNERGPEANMIASVTEHKLETHAPEKYNDNEFANSASGSRLMNRAAWVSA